MTRKLIAEKERKRPFSISVEDDLKEEFLVECDNKELSASAVIRDFMKNYIKQSKRKRENES